MNDGNYDYICTHCGSNNVLHDAWARWNHLLRCFELTTVYDDKQCGDCDAKFKHLEPTTLPDE